MKALTYFIPLVEKIRSLENPTSRNFKHARVVPSFFENLIKITLETVRIAFEITQFLKFSLFLLYDILIKIHNHIQNLKILQSCFNFS